MKTRDDFYSHGKTLLEVRGHHPTTFWDCGFHGVIFSNQLGNRVISLSVPKGALNQQLDAIFNVALPEMFHVSKTQTLILGSSTLTSDIVLKGNLLCTCTI